MRILTVRQPWAWAIIHGGKDVENRVRNIAGSYRGPVAIHVGLTWDGSPYDHTLIVKAHSAQRLVDGLSLAVRDTEVMGPQRGHIIGVVDLVDVHVARAAASGRLVDWADGTKPGELCSEWAMWDNYHLVFANPRRLAKPLPYKGALGLRELPEDVAATVRGLL